MTTTSPAPGPDPLRAYGYGPAVAHHFPPEGGFLPGRAVRVDRGRVLVASGRGLESLPLPAEPVVTGDWLRLAAAASGPDEPPRILGILPRRTVLRRKDAHDDSSREQLLAANMDVVAVVVPVDRPLSENRLERTLVAAWDSGATPLVVVTKADLAGVADDVVARLAHDTAGAAVVTTAAETGDGIDELATHCPEGTTLAFLGPSGAGKSTLVNALVGRAVQSTGPVRAVDGRGRHTTASRQLIPLPGGGVLLDTPGLRGFALWDAEEGLGDVFADIGELAASCRFTDCAHASEPGCAVLAALEDGTLEERRWLSYLHMQRELAALHRRQDVLARREWRRETERRLHARSQRDAHRRRVEHGE